MLCSFRFFVGYWIEQTLNSTGYCSGPRSPGIYLGSYLRNNSLRRTDMTFEGRAYLGSYEGFSIVSVALPLLSGLHRDLLKRCRHTRVYLW